MADRPVLRADAKRNREAIVAAATATFAELGLDAPLDEIARRAGVGNATLYRRFPVREQLVAAVFEERMEALVGAAEKALEALDPWSGFCEYVRALCRLQAGDRGFADLILLGVGDERIAALRTRSYEVAQALAGCAQAVGALRADFVSEDLVLLLMANAGVVQRTARDAPTSSERFIALALDGFRAEGASPLPPPPGQRGLRVALGLKRRGGSAARSS